MKPYVCKKHGAVEPYIAVYVDDRGKERPFRQCPICRADASRKYNAEKKAEIAAYHAEWYAENRDHVLSVGQQYRDQLHQEVVAGYGGKCECCGETRWQFLTIDHINGGGGQLRRTTQKGQKLYRDLRRLGFPRDGHRLLCLNCNFAIGRYGYCPHQKE